MNEVGIQHVWIPWRYDYANVKQWSLYFVTNSTTPCFIFIQVGHLMDTKLLHQLIWYFILNTQDTKCIP